MFSDEIFEEARKAAIEYLAKNRVYVHPHQREGHPVEGFWREYAHEFEQAMHTTPFRKPTAEEHRGYLAQAKLAYSEARPTLRPEWNGPELPLADDEDYERMRGMLYAIGAYNDFHPARVSKLVASLADTGHIDGYRPGRESSVAMYLHLSEETNFEQLAQAMRDEGQADETDPAGPEQGLYVGGRWMRAWWD